MLFKEYMQDTKTLIHKFFKNLKSSFHGGYQKLPKATNFLLCRGNISKYHQKDQFYIDLCNEWESLHLGKKEERQSPLLYQEPMRKEDNLCGGSFIKFSNPGGSMSEKEKEKKKEVKRKLNLKEDVDPCLKQKHGGEMALARKMKELEMMDVGDVEHVLDVEEALHYYSRLRSPVYLDMVDNFFMDMYSEFSVPKGSVRMNSKRRRSSVRL